ncbi:TPA: hypothetical protein ENS27_04980 [bacterium]|nr:hypothetical protein [bacterium]
MTKWVTISEASVILGVSERTIWRRIADGTYEAKIEGTRKLVKVVTTDDVSVVNGMPSTDKDGMINWLKNQLEDRNKQINNLHEEIKNNRDKSDAIIMKLTEELEAQRLLFQGIKPEKKRDRSFWKLLGKNNDEPET